MSDEVGETVNENQKFGGCVGWLKKKTRLLVQITKPQPGNPKVKPQKEKDPKKVGQRLKLGKKQPRSWQKKNRSSERSPLSEREIKREIMPEKPRKEAANENSAGWLPALRCLSRPSLTDLSLVGIAFMSAFEPVSNVFGQNQVLEVKPQKKTPRFRP